MTVLDKIPTIRTWIVAVLMFSAGWVGGWTMHGMQQYNMVHEINGARFDGFVNGDQTRWMITKFHPDKGEKPTGEYSFCDKNAAIEMHAESGAIIETIRFVWNGGCIEIDNYPNLGLGLLWDRNTKNNLVVKETKYGRP